MEFCKTCERVMDVTEDPTTQSRDGECLRCAAVIGGDPDSLEELKAIMKDLDLISTINRRNEAHSKILGELESASKLHALNTVMSLMSTEQLEAAVKNISKA